MNSLPDLGAVVSQRPLSAGEIAAALTDLLDATVASALKEVFLRAWAVRGETAEELAACAEALLPAAQDPGVRGSWQGKPLLDCCGTGGGGLNVLNVSTGLMFILTALGIPVVKHGNRGVTKRSGSADVLEAMGIKIDSAPGEVSSCLEKVGCAFLYAPSYHTAFAAVASARRALAAEGQRTVFNLLGPLLNPARPDARLVGVFHAEQVPLYHEALSSMHCPRYTVVCGTDRETGRALGEVSAEGANLFRGTLLLRELTRTADCHEHLDSLLVRNADESAARLETILSSEEQGLGRETLLINAAVASWTHGTTTSLEHGLAAATEALDSGAALKVLRTWQTLSE